ncbi:MAG: cytochrome c biogenesis protein CcsA [Pseudomonadota bacterium]
MQTDAATSLAFVLSRTALLAAAGLYAVAFGLAMLGPARGRVLAGLGVAAHLLAMSLRGVLIAYFPLTNKMESFSTAALAVALVLVLTWQPRRSFLLPMFVVIGAAMAMAFSFGLELHDAPPLMRTIWYPLHVPASFLAYGLWTAAAASALRWWLERSVDSLQSVQDLALWGFGLWSLAMVCGGVWGVLAWGAYFLWDPKVLWSVILWFHYATFVHLRLSPTLQLRVWLRPLLAVTGFGFVLVAYVGTSFLFGNSSHGWR